MPTFLLYVKAVLDNVASLALPPGVRFCLDVKESAGAEVRQGVYVTSTETMELNGSKGSANLVMKFAKGSKNEASINVVEVKGVTRALTDEDDGRWVPIMGFECRGLEPIAFHPRDADWVVRSAGGAALEDVDLSEGEWMDVCPKTNEPVSISEFESKLQVHKGK